MSSQAIELEGPSELRLRALTRLTGHADAADSRVNASKALGVLFELASNPATSGEALTLLHEIQVHQVELDMQGEELRSARAELEARLARQIQLYDLAPVATFTVDAGTSICELNPAGARLLGAERDVLLGRRLDQLLTPEGGGMLRQMLAGVVDAAPARTRTLHLAASGHAVQARAGADAVNGRFLVALMSAAE